MKSALLAGLLLSMPAVALAGTCANPTPLASLQAIPDATTCGGGHGINMGGTIYGHSTQVYKFHINHAGPGGAPTTISLTGDDREAVIVTSCNDDSSQGPAPIGDPLAGALGPHDVSGLADGDYLLVVSTDPSIDPQNADLCGPVNITAGVLPVSLTNFSVE